MFIPALWVAALAVGAAIRLTRLVTRDTITKPIRDRIEARYGQHSLITEFVNCAWCVGFWVSAAVVGLLFTPASNHPAFIVPAAALTCSWLVALAQRWLDN